MLTVKYLCVKGATYMDNPFLNNYVNCSLGIQILLILNSDFEYCNLHLKVIQVMSVSSNTQYFVFVFKYVLYL